MKLSFTTLGCPNWDLDTIITKAVAYGYDGVDFRGLLGEMDLYKRPEFSTNLEETIQKFKDANLELTCFSSSVRLFTTSEEEVEKFLEELREYTALCQKFFTPYIRVFGGHIGEMSREEALAVVKSNLEKMLPIVEEGNVQLLLETHDDWTRFEDVLAVLESVPSDHLHVLWDVHHPYRLVNEEPEKTLEAYGDRMKYTHWKDSYLTDKSDRGYELCLLGEGDIPLKEMAYLLMDHNYDGYYTLEWEKVWHPQLEEPEIAFKQYVQFMKEIAQAYKDEKGT